MRKYPDDKGTVDGYLSISAQRWIRDPKRCWLSGQSLVEARRHLGGQIILLVWIGAQAVDLDLEDPHRLLNLRVLASADTDQGWA